MRQKVTKQRLKEALAKSLGMVSHAAKILGCTRPTVYSAIRRHQLGGYLAECREMCLDYAEGRLIQHVEDMSLDAVIFLLNNLGGSRGYGPQAHIYHEQRAKAIAAAEAADKATRRPPAAAKATTATSHDAEAAKVCKLHQPAAKVVPERLA